MTIPAVQREALQADIAKAQKQLDEANSILDRDREAAMQASLAIALGTLAIHRPPSATASFHRIFQHCSSRHTVLWPRHALVLLAASLQRLNKQDMSQ